MRLLNPSGGRDSQQARNVANAMPASDIRSVESGSYNVADNIGSIACSTMRGPTTVTLPRAALYPGRTITIKKADSGSYPVTVKAANDESIGGQASVQLTTQNEYAQFVSTGSEWTVPVHF